MNATPSTEPQPVDTPTPQQLLEAAQAAAQKAADHLRSLDRDDLAREYKTSSHDIVTVHDRACEDIIVASLRESVPGCRIVGEEGGTRPAEPGDDGAAVTFFVDPIDGTSNFAAGMPLFCISIGVAVGRELVAGVIDAPILGLVFTAADGPAMLNGTALTPRDTHDAQDALVLSGLPGYRISTEQPDFAPQVVTRLATSVSAVRCLGSAALELAFVAAGWADATALSRINSWDIAAGFHLVRQAGGSIRTWPGEGPVDAPDHERPAYVACTGPQRIGVLDEIQEELQQLREAGAGNL